MDFKGLREGAMKDGRIGVKVISERDMLLKLLEQALKIIELLNEISKRQETANHLTRKCEFK